MNLLLFLFVTAGLALSASASVGDIVDEYDLIAMAKDEKTFPRTIACLEKQIPCPDLDRLRENGAKLFKTNCGDCTPAQKEKFENFKSIMAKAHPKEYELIQKLVSEAA